MRLQFEDGIEIHVSPNGRRAHVTVYRSGQLLDQAAIDLDDPLQRERWALQLRERHEAPWLDILRDVALALTEEDGGEGIYWFTGTPLSFSPPAFPVEALPLKAREFVEAGAKALDCPVDFIVTPLLALAAGVAGNRYELRVNAAWRERPILWTASVGDPGTGKSPALELALAPVLELQREAQEAWQAEMEEFEREVARARKEGERLPERPELEHYTTTDSTLEAIARILGHKRSVTPGLCLVRDELVSWVRGYDAYHPRGERQIWMSLWAGAAVKVDRATRDTAFIPRPALSVTGGIQPDMLPRLEEEAGVADGFIERFLYSFPPAPPMELRRAVPEVPDLAPLLGELRRAPAGEVALSEGAWEELEAWHETNRQAQLESWGLEKRYLAKLPRHVLRLALVLHLLRHPEAPASCALSRDTMRGAIELGGYFLAHARQVFIHFAEGATARRVLTILRAHGGEASQGALQAQLSEPQRQELPLARRLLERLGLLEVAQATLQGRGRPAVVWRLVSPQKGTPLPVNQKNPPAPLEEVL